MTKAVYRQQSEPGPCIAQPVRGTPPSSNGGKNPPNPPIALTRPVTVPVSRGKCCGTSLNTAPLPRPIRTAQPSAPTVNGRIDGQISNNENGMQPKNTLDSRRAPQFCPRANRPPDEAASRARRSRGAQPGVGRRQIELVLKQARQIDGERHEAAESQKIKPGEYPRQSARVPTARPSTQATRASP